MTEILRRLLFNPLTAIGLLVVSLLVNLLALAAPLFVIQVLNRYVAYGIDATLVTLTGGILLAIIFEFVFRLLRRRMILPIAGSSEYESKILYFSLTRTKAFILDTLPDDFKCRALRIQRDIEDAYGNPNIALVLDLPFAPVFLGALYLLSPLLSLVACILTVTGFLIGIGMHFWTRSLTAGFLAEISHNNALTQSFFRCVDTVRMFSSGTSLRDAWIKSSDQVWDLNQRLNGRKEFGQSLISMVIGLMTVSIISLGATIVVAGDLGVAELIGANILAARALLPIVRYSQVVGIFSIGAQSLKALNAFEALPKENVRGTKLKKFQGKLDLYGVGFTYSGTNMPLFQSVSLCLAPGEALIITGPNGSGKSTLARIILGLLDPGSGKVRLDGIDLQQINPRWWRKQVVYLPQEPYLMNGTIRNSILMSNPDLEDKDLEKILEKVGLKTFLDGSEQGLDAIINNCGLDLSLGIRRRIALARALVNNGQIVLFDEPTEGMDPWGCSVIYKLMNEFIKSGKTVIAISHDQYILKGAKHILNLEIKPVPSLFTKGTESTQVKNDSSVDSQKITGDEVA